MGCVIQDCFIPTGSPIPVSESSRDLPRQVRSQQGRCLTLHAWQVSAEPHQSVAGEISRESCFAGSRFLCGDVGDERDAVISRRNDVAGDKADFVAVVTEQLAGHDDVRCSTCHEPECSVALDFFSQCRRGGIAKARFEGAVGDGDDLDGSIARAKSIAWAEAITRTAAQRYQKSSRQNVASQPHVISPSLGVAA